MANRRMARLAALACATALTTIGCAKLLPSGSQSGGQFSSWEDALAAFDAVEVGTTGPDDLVELGFDPNRDGISVHAYPAIGGYFLPHRGATLAMHDPAVAACLQAQERCRVWKIESVRNKGKRESNLLLDMLRFHRKKHIQGYVFTAIVLVQDDEVTYKLHQGTPRYALLEEEVRPLGFLQRGPVVRVIPLDATKILLGAAPDTESSDDDETVRFGSSSTALETDDRRRLRGIGVSDDLGHDTLFEVEFED